MTENPKSTFMWQEYAVNHTGICVGYYPLVLFQDISRFGQCGRVDYYDTLPIIHPHADVFEKTTKQIYSKLRKWEQEEEFRIAKTYEENVGNDGDERKAQIPISGFAEVILGANMSLEIKTEIRTLIEAILPRVPLKQARIAEDNKIEIVEVE